MCHVPLLSDPQAELTRCGDALARCQGERDALQGQISNDAQVVGDKQALEDAVKKQDAVIARQDEEMSVMASRLANLQSELSTSSTAVETLQLKSSGYTELKILFDNPWLVAVTRWRLAGEAPHPRSGNTLSCFGTKLLLVILQAPRTETAMRLARALQAVGSQDFY
eukprot:jgi/Astpho2/4087/Aster-x0191